MRSFAGNLRGLTLLLGSMATGITERDLPYLNDGPCGFQPGVDYSVFADAAESRNSQRKLRVTVTLPAQPAEALSSPGQTNRTPPYPIVYFLNGFLVSSVSALVTVASAVLQGQDTFPAVETSLLQCICQPFGKLGLCSRTI